MSFRPEVEAFIKNFVKDLAENNVAIFAGAGMSKGAGYVDWPELLRDVAAELGLAVEKEVDLFSLAQFHVNALGSSAGLAKKILEEFSEQAEPSLTHDILARLPIRTYWTTNYDSLLEDALKRACRVADVKHSVSQMNTSRPKRDAVVYKMHGDVTVASEAVLHKAQYERYYRSHESFITALSGDLISKTFLFIGFSFTDPNLDYVLSRLHVQNAIRPHYCFMRREVVTDGEDEDIVKYKARKQELRVDDLKRFGIQTLLIDGYEEVPLILEEIEKRFRKKTVFVSGSAEDFGDWPRNEAQEFIHSLASSLVVENARVVNGFGWGVGSAVINGALEAIYSSPEKYSEDQLVMRPFPQFASGSQDLQQLWEQYRQQMISLAGVAIFVFGNKTDKDGNIIEANGVIREFEIASEKGLVPIPVGATGFAALKIWQTILSHPNSYYRGIEWIVPLVAELADPTVVRTELVEKLVRIIQRLNR
ncbi:SIR2 family protein [Burkholderiaceae bacterium]|nr:SIR2 family protein [Burkholderiaceae bacterium]